MVSKVGPMGPSKWSSTSRKSANVIIKIKKGLTFGSYQCHAKIGIVSLPSALADRIKRSIGHTRHIARLDRTLYASIVAECKINPQHKIRSDILSEQTSNLQA